MADPEKPPRKPPRRRPRKGDGDGDDDERREPYEEEPDAVRIHEAYLQHRLAGGEEPDPEAYRRAIEEFERLPGALPTIPPSPPEESRNEDEDQDEGRAR